MTQDLDTTTGFPCREYQFSMLFRAILYRVRLTFQDLVGSGPSATPNEGGEATASCDSLRQLYESAVASSSAYAHETPRAKSGKHILSERPGRSCITCAFGG